MSGKNLDVNFVSKHVNFVSYLVAAPQLCYIVNNEWNHSWHFRTTQKMQTNRQGDKNHEKND